MSQKRHQKNRKVRSLTCLGSDSLELDKISSPAFGNIVGFAMNHPYNGIETPLESEESRIFKKSTAIMEQVIIRNTRLRFTFRYSLPANILQEYK